MIEAVHPVLMARDISESIDFFERLGFTCIYDSKTAPQYAVVVRDACELHLQWQDSAQWDGSRDRPSYRFLVTDVDGMFRDFRMAEALPASEGSNSPYREPSDTPWGTREFHLHDPADNVLQFYRPVSRTEATTE